MRLSDAKKHKIAILRDLAAKAQQLSPAYNLLRIRVVTPLLIVGD